MKEYRKTEFLKKSIETIGGPGGIQSILKDARAFSHTNLQLTYLEK